MLDTKDLPDILRVDGRAGVLGIMAMKIIIESKTQPP